MSVKQWLPLVALVICVFIVNMSEFVPIGLLTDIATDFSISDSIAALSATVLLPVPGDPVIIVILPCVIYSASLCSCLFNIVLITN